MAKDIVRSRDYDGATRRIPQVQMGEMETAAIRKAIGAERQTYSLLLRLVEEDYGPEGDVCILPSQLMAFKEELDRFRDMVTKKAPSGPIYAFGKANLSVEDLLDLVDRVSTLAG